jgi:hypothetical protein
VQHRVIDGFKICPQCGENKEVETGYYKCGEYQKCMSWCKACCKKLRPQNKDYFKSYYQSHKKHRQETDREGRYGVTPEMFDFCLEQQGNVCGICSTSDPGNQNWHTDHCHNTEQFRGVLCNNCNSLLGRAKDNTDILRKAIEYLNAQVEIQIV